MNFAKFDVLSLLLSTSLGWAVVGCGGNGSDSSIVPCKPKAVECLSLQIGQICDGQGRWATFQCAPGQSCAGGECVATPSTSTEGCQLASECTAGQLCREGYCVSACTSNERTCVTSTVLQVCSGNGSEPDITECPVGSECRSGECVGTCVPNARNCSSSHVARECRADGSGYIELPCTEGRYCEEGRCVGDPYSECFAGYAVCKDFFTALVCKKDGSGYESKPCAQGTFCADGQCWGPVCAAGASECLSNAISKSPGMITCDDDGASYTVKFCTGKELCLQDYYSTYGQCYEPPCTLGEVVCGDPENPGSMPQRLSRCETLSDSRRGWVAYDCGAPSTCKEIDGRARCVHPCVPGDQRCGEDMYGIDTCDQNGNWVVVPCDADGGTLACVKVPFDGRIVCGDTECRELQGDSTTYKVNGVCEDTQIRRCGEDGRLKPPVDCDYGDCVYDGRRFGMCQGAK